MNFFWELFSGLPQQGPGSDQATREALKTVPALPVGARILDIGCGTGRQSLVLARETRGHITAVDVHEPFLEELRRRADTHGLSARLATLQASMSALDFPDESFDLIWSEGAIYIMGFREGLTKWRRLLRSGGFLAVTEVSWLVDDRSEELRAFWAANYPAITDIAGNLRTIAEAGYRARKHFVLPASAWWDGYYIPLEARMRALREKYPGDAEAQSVLDETRTEIDFYRRYSHAYGYVFYVMQKPG